MLHFKRHVRLCLDTLIVAQFLVAVSKPSIYHPSAVTQSSVNMWPHFHFIYLNIILNKTIRNWRVSNLDSGWTPQTNKLQNGDVKSQYFSSHSDLGNPTIEYLCFLVCCTVIDYRATQFRNLCLETSPLLWKKIPCVYVLNF